MDEQQQREQSRIEHRNTSADAGTNQSFSLGAQGVSSQVSPRMKPETVLKRTEFMLDSVDKILNRIEPILCNFGKFVTFDLLN